MSGRRPRPDPNQFALDFQSREDERRYLLRTCRFRTGTRYAKVRFLLELIHNYGKDGSLDWTRSELAERMSLSESGLVDTINDACYLGVLVVEEQRRADRSQAPNRLRIQWNGLVTFLPGRSDGCVTLPPSRRHGGDQVRTRGGGEQSSRPAAASPPPPGESATGGLRTATPGSDFATGGSRIAAPLREETFSSSSQELTSSPSSPCSWRREEEEALRRRLSGLGMACARAAVDIAQRHGLSAADLEALIEHYRGIRARYSQYSVGALYAAIRHAEPGLPPEQFFVGVPESARQAAHEAAQRRQRAEEARRHAANRQAAEADRDSYRRLEAEYGPHLDALPADELRSLVDGVLDDFLRQLFRRDRRNAVAREPLLLALQARSTVNHGDPS